VNTHEFVYSCEEIWIIYLILIVIGHSYECPIRRSSCIGYLNVNCKHYNRNSQVDKVFLDFKKFKKKIALDKDMKWMRSLLSSFVSFSVASAVSIWTQKDGNIYRDGKTVQLRGLSWFGFETQDFVANGMYSHSMDFYFDKMKSIGINAIRVPFSAEWIYYNFDVYPYNGFYSADPSLAGKKSIEILDMFFDKAEANGMVIMLDLHRLHKEYISELWYSPTDGQYPSSVFYSVWETILDRYKDRPNLMAVDLLNEPHGRATWGSGNPATDWNGFVEEAIPRLSERFPDHHWLYFMEGINWGHNLDGYRQAPIRFEDTQLYERLVFSAHIYGNSVVPGTSTDPNVLYPQWDYSFGFLKNDYGETVVVGEWGGKTSIDQYWMTVFTNYIAVRGMNSNFFWSLMPNSGDVQGLLLDDYTTLDSFKVEIMQRTTPLAVPFSF